MPQVTPPPRMVPVTNPGKHEMPLQGVMIPPGETRHFDERYLPPRFRPKPEAKAPEPPPDPLAGVLEGSVEVVKGLIPQLSADDLARLPEVEAANKNRKGVLDAAEAERMRRAAEAAQGGGGGEGQG